MEIVKKLFKNKLFMIGLLIPLIFQIVYLCIAIPAIKYGDTGIQELNIAIVNEDTVLGKDVSQKLVQVLPFNTFESSDLPGSLNFMNEGEFNMVVYIASDFTAKCQQGGAQVSYYINQAAPSMTKQAMERTAISINQTLNENSFNSIKDTLKKYSLEGLAKAGLPEVAQAQISANLSTTFDTLKYTTIKADLQKVNNADGFAQGVLPFFIFLTYFVGSIIVTILHLQAYKALVKEFSRVKILFTQLSINLIYSLLVPSIVVGLCACFDIPFSLGVGITWLLLSVGFFTLLSTVQMFANWFGIPGMGVAVLLLFPLQLITSGLIYSKEILPSFYSAVSNYLPATYLGDGMLKVFYGGPSISEDFWILLLMSAIVICLSALTVFKKDKEE
jgi:uncharacterized phage infection (PIP) family protein YhgE